MAIEIKVTIQELPDGSVSTHCQSCSIGTTKETLYGLLIVKAVEATSKFIVEQAGGHQTQIHSYRKIAPIKGEGGD